MLLDKSAIRKEALKRRDDITHSAKSQKDSAITAKVLSLDVLIPAYKILLYASFKSEVDTTNLIKYCLSQGKHVVLPKVDAKKMLLMLYEIKDISELNRGYMGIPEPNANIDNLRFVNDMDIIIVPGVAFDSHCNRLGYGKGFYDRLLAEADGSVVGLAYEEQMDESLPAGQHDIRMDIIVTDERIITCNG
jgi:5-formyltetrahydrofolate cyclo-ligase